MCQRSGWSLSNLELQKIIYIAHMFHLGKTGEPLVSGQFEAWDYGPVHPTIYHKVKVFGASPVENVFHSVVDLPDESPEASTIDAAVDQLGDSKPGRLVAITHWEGGAWTKHYTPGERCIAIPNEDILQEYTDRYNAAKAKN